MTEPPLPPPPEEGRKRLRVSDIFLVLALLIAIGLLVYSIYVSKKEPKITFVKQVVFNNNTVYLYRVDIHGSSYYYLCPAKLPEGRKCIITPMNLICEFYTPCVRVYGIIKS